MPGKQPALENVAARPIRAASRQLLVSCEHASNRIPPRYAGLGLSAAKLQSHIAWDPGVRSVAAACAKALGCSYHEGRYSRLLVDLNRSLHHPRLMAKRTFGVAVPGNQRITREDREERVARYYHPYRTKVLEEIRRILARHGRCIHLSFHSFAPRAAGILRKADVGILYDPGRPSEKALALHLADRLGEFGLAVRRNYPYRGVNDGFTTFCRRLFGDAEYRGLEIEVNQRLVLTLKERRRVARLLSAAFTQGLWVA